MTGYKTITGMSLRQLSEALAAGEVTSRQATQAYLDAIAAAEETFYRIGTGDITVGNMSLMFTDETRKNNFHSMPAVLHFKHVAGVKWISTFSAPLPGYTFCHGTSILLSDTNTGSPIALVGGTSITAMRTAGGHGVVQAKHLTNPDPETLTVMGCGLQARARLSDAVPVHPAGAAL